MKILFFTAPFCSKCKIVKKLLEPVEGITSFNAETQMDEFDARNVSTIPTLIICDDNGNEVKRLTNTISRSTLLDAGIQL